MGWIPHFYDQMDLSYKVNAHWAERLLGLPIFERLVTRWPHSLEVFDEQFGEAPEADRYQLTAGNCMRFLRLEAARG